MLDTAGNKELQDTFRSQLKSIYGNLKTCDEYFVLDVESGKADDFMTRLQSLFKAYHYDQIDLGHLELHYRNMIYLAMQDYKDRRRLRQ